MLAAGIRNVVTENVSLIRGGEQGPAMITTERGKSRDGKFGKAEINGCGYTGVDAVGDGIHTGVSGENALVEAVVAKFGLVNQAGSEDARPVKAKNLRPSNSLGFPEGLKNLDVLLGLKAISDEITSGQSVLVVWMPIDFDEAIIFTIAVGKAELKILGIVRATRSRVRREEREKFSAKWIDGNACRGKGRCGVGNAVGRVRRCQRDGCGSLENAGVSNPCANTFVCDKVEQLILNNGAADGCAKIMETQSFLRGWLDAIRRRHSAGVKEVASVEGVVAAEIVCGAVISVGAGL